MLSRLAVIFQSPAGLLGCRARLRGAAVAAGTLCALASPATYAAVPSFAQLEGVLIATGGAPAADGDYDLTFAIYAAASGGSAVWSEGPIKVKVAGGRLAAQIGATKALDGAALAALPEQWLGVQVGAEPELPRQRLSSAPLALVAGAAHGLACSGCVGADHIANGGVAAAKVGFNYAASSTKGGPAADLDCTGCVGVGELKFDADVDLGGNSLKAKNGTFGGDVVAKSVTATSFVGDGSKLTGLKTPAGTCKSGEVVTGIKDDGSLACGSFAGSLPGDSIAATSNGVISNVFNDTFAAPTKAVPIPDNNGSSATSEVVVPDLGLARDIVVTVKIANSDLAGLSVKLLPPDDKAKGWTLCDPCGKTDEKALDKSWSVKAPPQAGDVQKWIGANAKGAWTLKVLDTSFCVPQKPGNKDLCDLTKQLDGNVIDWTMAIETLSNGKVHDPKGHLFSRVASVEDKALADGKTLEIDTKAGTPAVVAQAWLYDAGKKQWLQASTGVDTVSGCSACGTGKDGDYKPTSSANLAGKVYEFKDFIIPKGVTITVTGATALHVRATGKVEIAGTLTLNGLAGASTTPNSNGCSSDTNCAAGGAAGPGGSSGAQGCYGNAGNKGNGSGGGGAGGYCSSYGAGGGGGGYGGGGNNGAAGDSNCTPGGGGSTYAGVHQGTLVGGSGGGSGGYGTSYNAGGGGGGGGGGAVRFDAPTIDILSGGAITADGGKGGDQTNNCDGGAGGGGSGGAIWLRAAKVAIAGSVSAKGGAAGDAVAGQSSQGGDGGAGGDGQVRIDSPNAAIGQTTPSYKTGDGADLGTLYNRFRVHQDTPGKVVLTNTSGQTHHVNFVVTY